MGPGILGLVGVLLALVGAAMMLFPRPLSFLLRLLGVRWQPHEASRVAAWGLVGIGLVVVVLTRAVR
ncbi:MAG TPA: hypothetical protein VFC09_16640 [Candidatus Dormibacteraeota bacterium]|nr:hypothetical protein [Candidatus Dormibacteraeota bacterium]